MSPSSKTAAWVAAATVGLVIGVLGFFILFPGEPDRFAQCRVGVGSGVAKIGGPFTLMSETGELVSDREVITKPSLVYFGYTYCPDVCPIDSTRNAAAADLLQTRGYAVVPVFISVDSDRDTPQSLRAFTDLMNPAMIGLTGTAQQIDTAVKAYRAYYRVQTPGDPDTLIDHSTQTYLMHPELGFLDYYDRDTPPEEMAQSVGCFMDVLKTKENQP